jgi:signal transduction histidine kinase
MMSGDPCHAKVIIMENEENQRILKINECFLSLTADPDRNIQLLTICCGELMGAACALYNRLQDGMLHTLAQWNAPPDFNPVDRPDGHICHDVIKYGGKAVLVIRDLHRTFYAGSDPNVSAYGLKTYVGAPVSCKDLCVGSICVVYQCDYTPDKEEKRLLQILAAALGVEEERREEIEALRAAKNELESRVRERTADLARVNEQLRIDIIERKQAEMALVGTNRELEKRTEELLEIQEELVRNEKLAVIGRLAGSVGHELRNPLGVMNNAVFFLKAVMTDADETVKEYLDIIKHEIDSSQRIITDLLDFARTKTPKVKAVMVSVLIEGSLGRCAVPENVDILSEIPAALPPLKVDPLQMEQVFYNIITNGIQAMPEGGALRISARKVQGSRFKVQGSEKNIAEHETLNVEPETDFMEISFTDTGKGILPENIKNIFQPLFTTKARGIGLGLAICKNLTQANDGSIAVESRVGKGTTFNLYLPLIEDVAVYSL